MPAGDFTVWASKAGFLSGRYGQELVDDVLPPRQVNLRSAARITDIEVALWPAAVLSGKVLDHDATPVVEAMVEVHQFTCVSGHPRWLRVGAHRTDDRGTYRIGDLRPGRYLVSATLDAAALPVFYPGTRAMEAAIPMVFEQDGPLERSAIDLHIPAGAMERGRIEGHIVGHDDGAFELLLYREVTPWMDQPAARVNAEDGAFTFDNVPFGRYRVRVIPGKQEQPVHDVGVVVDRSRPVSLTIRPGPGAAIAGRLSFDSPPAAQVDTGRGMIWLDRVDGIDTYLPLRRSRLLVDENGQFRISESQSRSVTIMLTSNIRGVTGIVRDVLSKPAARAFVYAFPTNDALWRDLGPVPRRLAMVETTARGEYQIELPPGDYYLIARARPFSEPWRCSPALEVLRQAARTVTVGPDSIFKQDLALSNGRF